MKTALKVDTIKFTFIISYLLIVLSAINAWAGGTDKKGCGESPFETNIIKFERNQSCFDVVLEVSFRDMAEFELSHASIDFGCGTVSNVWNSEGWKMESNHIDPTTGMGGIKIDDISNFGKDTNFKSFQVKFTFCPDENCSDSDKQFNPKVAYKAGQCIYYEKPSNHNCGSDEDGKGDNEGDDDGDGDDGDDNTNDGGNGDSSGGNPDGTPPIDNSQITIKVNSTDPTCLDPSEGTIILEISGGSEPYDINWNNGATTQSLSGLSAGTYSFVVSDANGNVSNGEVTLGSPDELVVESTIIKPDCQGFSNGAIDLTVIGGTEPYSFAWSNGEITQNLEGLYAGTYSVHITDANGCSIIQYIPLYNETNIIINDEVTQPSCQLGTSGNINLTPSGGAEPYSYTWSNGATSSSIEGLTDGFYEVTIVDQNGCSYAKTYEISTNVGIDVYASITKTNCFNDPMGAIDLNISGGTEPYTILWSNGETSEDINSLSSGNYTATITDALGCQTTYKASVMEDDITIGYQGISIPSCFGSSDGAISINLSNGTEPYDIEWSNGSTNEDISGLTVGNYTVKVTDALGCVSERSFYLPEPEPVQISYTVNSNECTGSQDIVVNATGGSLEYTYLWSDGSASNELINAEPGNYAVTATDTRGCSATQEITVDAIQSQQLECLISDAGTEVMCGSTGNQLSSSLSGVISYSWSVSSSDGSWVIVSAADQSQIAYDAGNEASSATFTLTVIYEGGCEISCEKIINVCTTTDTPVDENPDNPDDGSTGGEHPDDGTAGGDIPDGGSEDDPDDQTDDNDESSGDDVNCDENQDNNEDDCNCSSDDGENDSDESDNSDDDDKDYNDKSCTECFSASPVSIVKEDDGYHYSMEINYEDCRYDLSHLTIGIPSCYEIIDYSNSMNWKMVEVNTDPTTGLSGIKVDDIPSFGKDPDLPSFTIDFILTVKDEACEDDIKCFAPVIAYKSATCVYEENTTSNCYVEEADENDLIVNTYPNPTCDFVKIDLKNCDESASYTAEIYDFNGERTYSSKFDPDKFKDLIIDLRSRKHGVYLLKLTSDKGICTTHRIVKY